MNFGSNMQTASRTLFDVNCENDEFGGNRRESCGDEVNLIPGKR